MHLPHGLALGNALQRLLQRISHTGVAKTVFVPDRHEIMPAFLDKEGLSPAKREKGLHEMTWWWARQDSNLEPDGYEPSALTIELRALG